MIRESSYLSLSMCVFHCTFTNSTCERNKNSIHKQSVCLFVWASLLAKSLNKQKTPSPSINLVHPSVDLTLRSLIRLILVWTVQKFQKG